MTHVSRLVLWVPLGARELQGTVCKGFVNLEGAIITDDSKSGKGNVFKVVVPNRTYYLNVDDPKDFAEWCEAFEFVAGPFHMAIPPRLRSRSRA